MPTEQLKLEVKGSPDAPIVVTLSEAATTKGVGALLSELAGAARISTVHEVWVRYEDGEEEGPLSKGRSLPRVLTGLDANDVIMLVERRGAPAAAAMGISDAEQRQLPAGEQRYKRLEQLIMQEPCVVPKLLRKAFENSWNSRYPNHRWDKSSKTVVQTRDNSGDVRAEEVLTSGLLFEKGSYRKLDFTVTWKVGSKEIVADDQAVDLYAAIAPRCQSSPSRIRLMAGDILELEVTVDYIDPKKLKAKNRSDNAHILRRFGPPISPTGFYKQRPAADVTGLQLWVTDGAVPGANMKKNYTTMRMLQVDGIDKWDITCLCKFLAEEKSHQLAPETVRASLNKAFRECVKDFVEAGLLSQEDQDLLRHAIEQLEDNTYVTKGPELALDRGLMGDVARNDRKVKRLTTGQITEFAELWDYVVKSGIRVLKQAPSGSGKSTICIKLCAQFLIEQFVQKRAGRHYSEEFGDEVEVSGRSMLLLVPSPILVEMMTLELQDDLQTRGVWIKSPQQAVGEAKLELEDVRDRCGAVYIMAVDTFVTAVESNATSRESVAAPVVYSGESLSLVVVDEGHLVFSYQPDPTIHGQHIFEDASKVRTVLDKKLEADAKVPMVIFHDDNYQRMNKLKEDQIPYPEGCINSKASLPIVRNPGAVRDLSIPFCKELNTNTAAHRKGKSFIQSFIPLLDESTGNLVQMVNVDPAIGRLKSFTPALLADWLGRDDKMKWRYEAESIEQTLRYADQIAVQLGKIKVQLILEHSSWNNFVAVLVPGAPPNLAMEMLVAARNVVNDDELLAILPKTPGYGPPGPGGGAGLYFGQAENFAGLERPYVIVTGMQHPRYLRHRSSVEGWTGGKSTVDPRVYLAVTRCTFKLTLIEIDVLKFGAHYAVSSAVGELDAVRMWGKAGVFKGKGSTAVVGPSAKGPDGLRSMQLAVSVNLQAPPEAAELKAARVLRVQGLTQEMWDNNKQSATPFSFENCESGVLELVVEHIPKKVKPMHRCKLLRSLLSSAGLQKLQILELRGNNLESLPAELGNLVSLTQLRVGNNKIASLPTELGQLFMLQELLLNNNCLKTVPPELGQLSSLTHLGLDNNKLRDIPAKLGNLAKLSTLKLHHNNLEKIPAELWNLNSLKHLALSENKLERLSENKLERLLLDGKGESQPITYLALYKNNLRSVPVEVSTLASLTHLDLRDNNIETIPAELGALKSLIMLALSRNKLTHVPTTFENLKSVVELSLDFNELTEIPPELGQLSSLLLLMLGHNSLASVPKALGTLSSLTTLGLEHNQLSSLPDEVGNLLQLTTLNLEHNKLSSLPDSLGGLRLLQTLRLENNSLRTLPSDLGQLAKLSTLRLDNNLLTELPPKLGELSSLAVLRIDHNELVKTPDQFFRHLTSLSELYLNNNKLEKVPPELEGLHSLTKLMLNHNTSLVPPPVSWEATSAAAPRLFF